MTTYIAYEGPSKIDGKPIVLLVQTGRQRNSKTGDMVQTFILRSDIDPITASRTGEDSSICGDCIHKGTPKNGDSGWAKNRTCYVNLLHGPNGKYKAYKKGSYGSLMSLNTLAEILDGQFVRVGSYGDPSAVPDSVWDVLLMNVKKWTGYTHAEKNPMPKKLMTSVESKKDAVAKWVNGERTFRIIPTVDDMDKEFEFLCPASKEGGMRTDCANCSLCAGNSVKAKSVAIVAHGNGKAKLIDKINTLAN